jgi:hypothetical protein
MGFITEKHCVRENGEGTREGWEAIKPGCKSDHAWRKKEGRLWQATRMCLTDIRLWGRSNGPRTQDMALWHPLWLCLQVSLPQADPSQWPSAAGIKAFSQKFLIIKPMCVEPHLLSCFLEGPGWAQAGMVCVEDLRENPTCCTITGNFLFLWGNCYKQKIVTMFFFRRSFTCSVTQKSQNISMMLNRKVLGLFFNATVHPMECKASQ